VAVRGLRYHSIFLFIPGMLREPYDVEQVVGLIAPRPHLTLTGDRDEGSPVGGVRTINAFQEHLYGLYGRADRFRGVVYPNTGHKFTGAMWREGLAWLSRHLQAR
jgi:hypothetical protein